MIHQSIDAVNQTTHYPVRANQKGIDMSQLLLNVPFSEKDDAKVKGARWNKELKKWYVPEGCPSIPFIPWIQELKETGKYDLYSEYYYIGVNESQCWKCCKKINLYAFCLPRGHKYLNIDYLDPDEFVIGEDNSQWQYSDYEGDMLSKTEIDGTIYTWAKNPCFSGASRVTDVDPRALSQIRHYSPVWRPGYSQTAGTSYYANHCPNCSRLQGDFMIFNEPGGAFLPDSPHQAAEIRLHKIDEPIFLNGGTCWSTCDFFEYMQQDE